MQAQQQQAETNFVMKLGEELILKFLDILGLRIVFISTTILNPEIRKKTNLKVCT
jgi:hypothetical protein